MNRKIVMVYVHSDILGDALLKLPAVALLKQAFPEHKIIWLAGCGKSIFKTSLYPLVKDYVDEIVDDVLIGGKRAEWFSSCPIKQHIDIIIDTQHILRTSFLKPFGVLCENSETLNILLFSKTSLSC